MRALLFIALLTGSLAGRPGLGVAAAMAQDSAPAPSAAVARGAEVAQRICSECHAVALEATSRVHDAPPFRVLARVYSAETLESKLADIAEFGHFEMPRVTLSEDQISDVSAYIASLEPLEDRASPKRPGSRPTAVRRSAGGRLASTRDFTGAS